MLAHALSSAAPTRSRSGSPGAGADAGANADRVRHEVGSATPGSCSKPAGGKVFQMQAGGAGAQPSDRSMGKPNSLQVCKGSSKQPEVAAAVAAAAGGAATAGATHATGGAERGNAAAGGAGSGSGDGTSGGRKTTPLAPRCKPNAIGQG